MIKGIELTLIILLLCGCSNSRIYHIEDYAEKFDYDEKTIEKIKSLDKKNQELVINDESADIIKLINDPNFIESNLQDYRKYNLKPEVVVYLVNNNIINDGNYELLKEICKDKYYIKENTNLYLRYSKTYETIRSVVEHINAGSYKDDYIDYEFSDTSKGNLMLVNKHNSLYMYKPSSLVEVEEENRCHDDNHLTKEAYDSYKEMIKDARDSGFDFYITSSYRSYDYQVKLYQSYIKQYGSQSYVDTFSARPGFSEHQTGLTIDVKLREGGFDEFHYSKEMYWLHCNAYRYGFILRYPLGKEDVTGYTYEWWHFRYVGKEAATYIYKNNITFDEYYAYFIKNTSN